MCWCYNHFSHKQTSEALFVLIVHLFDMFTSVYNYLEGVFEKKNVFNYYVVHKAYCYM